MNLLDAASRGKTTAAMKEVARDEGVAVARIAALMKRGRLVIPMNRLRRGRVRAVGIGDGLRTKVNANVGTSARASDRAFERKKVRAAIEAGADAVMDLSTGRDIDSTLAAVLDTSTVPVGTVPVYQAAIEAGDPTRMTARSILDAVRRHARMGVDFLTLHCGIRQAAVPLLRKRLVGVVSRGGAFLLKWMACHGADNPLYTHYDEVLDICREYDVTISLGDGLRPGCLADATDAAQISELKNLGRLAARALKRGVQTMIEGPGHVPIDQIERNVRLEKQYCHGAPFYVLGPIVTDVAPGYDHITSAIGGALAAWHGANFLCYVTRREHLGLPDIDDVREGVYAARIAAHAADVARGLKGARNWDDEMSRARVGLDWDRMFELALDPKTAGKLKGKTPARGEDTCSMCGKYCSMKIFRDL
ncbi:MAG: phosphomethylpyrimidine synthase ThiC [Planctomycetota bacterium]|nr:phosphomethylpyrimidine synthase ThiC [Planctomycetota bacterium]